MSEGRKRKKAYYKGKYGGKKSRYNNDLTPKCKGFIVTTSGKERSATLEAYRLLNEYADKRFGPEELKNNKGEENGSNGEEEECDDIDQLLKKEVAGIKNACKKDTERRFQSVQTKAKNVIFIKTNIPDPSQLATDIFSDIKEKGIRKTQHCQRILPVIETCYAKMDQILTAATPIIKSHFHDSSESFSFNIKFKTRCNSGIKKDEIFKELCKIVFEVDKGHSTDYDHPEVVLNVDIIGNICCFGVLRNFNHFARYNVDMVVGKEKEQQVSRMSNEKISPQTTPSTSTNEAVENKEFMTEDIENPSNDNASVEKELMNETAGDAKVESNHVSPEKIETTIGTEDTGRTKTVATTPPTVATTQPTSDELTEVTRTSTLTTSELATNTATETV